MTAHFQLILSAVLIAASIQLGTTHNWRSRRDALLGTKRASKGSKAGWRRVKKRTFSKDKKDKQWEWERIDLHPDSPLRVGVKYRHKSCPSRSKSGDFLSVHYNGTLFSNGDLFDSSILREEPFVFQIGQNQTIDGWEKGLLNMCVGEKRKLIVPSGMAYGATKAHGSELAGRVMPDSTVVYHVELLDILTEDDAAPHLVWGL